MKAKALKAKWRKDIEKDTQRENTMDEERLDEKCPYIRTIGYGGESQDICDLVDKWCLIEHGQYDCAIWDEIRLRDKEKK